MTAANKITLSRIAVIPFFLVFVSIDNKACRIIALILFILASLTDGVDGYVARKYDQVTNFGKFIDPLADKLLVCSALLALMMKGLTPLWCVALILFREFIVTSLRTVAAAEGVVIAASIWGKIKTFSQIVCIIILLAGINFTIIPNVLDVKLLCAIIMGFTTAFSGIKYVVDNFSVISDGVSKGEHK